MAKVLGETARYVTNQAIKKFQKQFTIIFIVICVTAFISGYLLGGRQHPFFFIPSLLFLIAIPPLFKYINRKIDQLEKERMDFRKGASGEALVGYILEGFPDDYRVIHDLATPFGNMDHVVVGPSGAYVIDTKNWKGVVAADGNGELLLNGEPTQKPEIKNLMRRIMDIKEKIKVLSSVDFYIQGVFAFPSAYVEAKWGATGYVHCVKDEGLYDYIVENKRSKKLTKKEIDEISRAFLALATMDKEFTS
jgi:hypothetical protein